MEVVTAIIRKDDKIFATQRGYVSGRTGGSFMAARWLAKDELKGVEWLPAIERGQDDVNISPAEREKARRSANMAAIRSKNTKPELIVRKGLWRMGFRYRLNSPRLPGHPDLVLRKYRTCIFVNGCFWHGHGVALPQVNSEERIVNSECCKIPKTNRAFWVAKIRRNQERDLEEQRRLAEMGWHCITVWECELKAKVREQTLKSLAFTLNKIWLEDHSVRKPYPTLKEEDGMLMAAEDIV